MEFNNIGHANESKAEGSKTKATGNTDARPVFGGLLMDTLMHVFAFHRQPVFLPDMLNMDQGALPLTKEQVLKRRELEQFVFGVHQAFNRFCASFSRK